MSETTSEMIIPGTYVNVFSEGLIGVGGISTGNVGVVGTASRGPLNQVTLLGSYGEALDAFGPYDAWSTAVGAHPLTLVRAMEHLFKGGATSVYAVRIGSSAAVPQTWTIKTGTGTAAVDS